MTTMTTTLASNVSQILSSIGLQLDWCRDADTADGIVALASISRDQADSAVSVLRAAGYEASWARDNEVAADLWLYVAASYVEVPAYVDAAGDLLVELPDQRGSVEVREATRSESIESASMTEGWITTRVARHLLVAVGYLPGTTTYSWSTDAASGELQATSVEAAVDALVAQGEWDALDSAREQRYIADGSWLLLHDADGCIVLRRGEV